MEEKPGAGTILGFVLMLIVSGTIGAVLGRHERNDRERECAAKGGELRYFDRSQLCVKPGFVLE
jgi:hypothetical protein